MKSEVITQDLEKEVKEQRNLLKTDRLDMSFSEIISMYDRGEVNINPAFQRFFRWDIVQKTRFIESLLLGIPIPPIFVAEDENGVWEVVDGLQRLSTVISFFGKLKNPNSENENDWVLEAGDRLPSLEGYNWESLPQKFRFSIQRYACRIEIVKWDSDYDMRFELFNRLNTGGETLTPQEIRNAIYRDISPKFNDFLKKLANKEEVIELLSLTTSKKKKLEDEELVLRFMSLYKNKGNIKSSISQHMSDFMLKALKTKNFDYEAYETIFLKTVKQLLPLGKDIFRRSNGAFATALYDIIMIGVAENFDLYENKDSSIILSKINKQVKQNEILNKTNRKGGNNQVRRVKNRLIAANEIFSTI
jgi:hypothetical protein